MSDHDKEKTGLMYAVNVPGFENWKQLDEETAKEVVTKYRWINVNASLKGDYGAEDEATKLSNAFDGRPIVLVYMSREIGDDTRDTYPGRLHASLASLIKAVIATDQQVLLTGRSYSVHQVLRAGCKINDPSILVIGIGPAFGAFGSPFSENVKQYITDIATARCKYGMVASKNDFWIWRAGGAAYKRKVGYRGDNDVGRAMDKNKQNVHIEVIEGADHSPIEEYLRHGMVGAMQRIVAHFNMDDLTDIVNGVSVTEE